MERLPVLHERLMIMRRRRGLTQECLADKVGMVKTDISKYERGVSMPTVARLAKLARALGCASDYLLGLAGDDASEEDAGTPLSTKMCGEKPVHGR